MASDALSPGRACTLPAKGFSLSAAASAFIFLGTRLAFAAFWLVTSTYCLLVYVPFAYFGFVQNPLLTWIPLFVHTHAAVYGVLWCGVAVTLIPDLGHPRTRRAAAGFLALNGVACLYLLRYPALGGVTPDLASYFWSIVSLFPLVWLAVLDLNAAAEFWWRPPRTSATLDVTVGTLAALTVSGAFALMAFARTSLEGHSMPAAAAFRGLGTSISFHLVIFLTVGLILQGIRFVSDRTPWPRQLYLVLSGVFACLLCTLTLRNLVLPTISFEGALANFLAGAVGLSILLYVTACVLRFQTVAVNLGFSPGVIPGWLTVPFVLSLFVAAYGIPVLIGRADWDFVLQRSAVIVLWVVVYWVIRCAGIRLRGRAVSIAVLAFACVAGGVSEYVRLKLDEPGTQAAWNSALDTYSGADISFRTAYSILARSFNNRAYAEFYEFLKQNTNLRPDAAVGPADTRLVSNLQPAPGERPNIFLFVIDSLRQDSISPYNSAVDYTPEIGRFAQDSVVMRNAFTRYGGTALSEPAIWVGAMQLHKQYIEPFYPMNNLQKVLEVDGYQSYISFDPILRRILRPAPSITELEADTTNWGELDFVPTLKKLEAAIDARGDQKRPIFAYSQPQNVHTLTIQRSRIKGGRKAVTAYELRRIDIAFGEFVRFLQQRGLYENSVIILTADHGDSYGEFGRWGHCDFLFPEVIRIPLIVHLPPRMRDRLVWDTQKVSFTTDITPSLYYLLGHRPILKNELFGHPLFTGTLQEQAVYARPYHLLVSSYAPVYAILDDNAKSLFIVDAVNGKNSFYNLAEDPLGTRNHVTTQIQSQYEPVIRQQVELIDRFYGWQLPQKGQ